MDERRRVSQKQERGVAKRLDARQHVGSGSGAKKHDLHNDNTLIECKTVLKGKRQITIQADDLGSLSYQAVIQGRMPVLHVEVAGKRWVLITEDDYVTLVEK